MPHNRVRVWRSLNNAMAAGANALVLPGPGNRAESLNPAAPVVPTADGARAWLTLAFRLSAVPGTTSCRLHWVFGAQPQVLIQYLAGSILAATAMPLLRGELVDVATSAIQISGLRFPLVVNDPHVLRFNLDNLAGTETLDMWGLYVETDDVDSPSPMVPPF